MQLEVFALLDGGQGHLRGVFRGLAEDWQFLENDTHVLVCVQNLQQVVEGAFAELAVVVEELDDGDVALRVAGHE